MVSGSLSLPSPGFFSPFPHGTYSLSVVAEYLALDRGRPRFRQGFSCLAVLRYRITESSTCRVRGFHPVSPAFPKPFHYVEDLSLRGLRPCGPTTPPYRWFRLFRFRSPLLPESLLISVPEVHEMVQFPQCGFRRLCIQRSDTGISPSGLPHSAIRGSQDICSFPRLFAACHGLLRLATPRHSPIDPYSLDHIIVLEFFASRRTSGVSLSRNPRHSRLKLKNSVRIAHSYAPFPMSQNRVSDSTKRLA